MYALDLYLTATAVSAERVALVGARVSVVVYGLIALVVLFRILRLTASIPSRAVILFTMLWHAVMLSCGAYLVVASRFHVRELFLATYGAAFTGALTGLLWLIVLGRRRISMIEAYHEQVQYVVADAVDTAVTTTMQRSAFLHPEEKSNE